VQFRISEVLCILPFFFPFSAWGLFIGCVLANLLSSFGVIDIVFGSLATLLAALGTMALGKISRERLWTKVLACLPPVVVNGVVVGAIIAYSATPDAFWAGFITNALWVAFGEFVVLYVIGLPLLIWLPKTRVFQKFKAQYMD
jgi:uncharacterized membrane protein